MPPRAVTDTLGGLKTVAFSTPKPGPARDRDGRADGGLYSSQPVVTWPSTLRAMSAILSPFTSTAMVVRSVSAE
jgi:hypothetical protein